MAAGPGGEGARNGDGDDPVRVVAVEPGVDLENRDAIEWAGHLRDVRSSICGLLRSGDVTLQDALAERQDAAVAAVHLLTVLESLPGARKIDTRRGLDSLGLQGRLPLGELDDADLDLVLGRFAEGVGPAGPAGPSGVDTSAPMDEGGGRG